MARPAQRHTVCFGARYACARPVRIRACVCPVLRTTRTPVRRARTSSVECAVSRPPGTARSCTERVATTAGMAPASRRRVGGRLMHAIVAATATVLAHRTVQAMTSARIVDVDDETTKRIRRYALHLVVSIPSTRRRRFGRCWFARRRHRALRPARRDRGARERGVVSTVAPGTASAFACRRNCQAETIGNRRGSNGSDLIVGEAWSAASADRARVDDRAGRGVPGVGELRRHRVSTERVRAST